MSQPSPISGFPEWLPAERIVEQQVLDALREVFELHGFASIQTRAVEPLDQLLRKGETSKEVYTLRRLQAEPDEPDDESSALGLHFDLTVPFARYVLENSGKLKFPFRRYQIQPVWRGERPQEGRYREFVQADIDIIDKDSLSFHHEVEIAQVMADVFARLPLPPVRLLVNSRKLIEGYYRGLGIADVDDAMRVVDKLDKIGAAGVEKTLVEDVGLSSEQARGCLALAEIAGDDASVRDRITALGVTHPLLDEGVDELVRVLEGTAGLRSDRFTVGADLAIARGLDYYTGTVYETRMEGFEHLGSICSGGRYDALASDGRTTYPGVGISLGVTRALAPLFSRGLLTASRSTPTAVLVALPADEQRAACTEVAAALRGRGIAVEVSPTAAKYGKQIRYAERRGIPFVWFPQGTEGHQVRDIRSGDQVDADPAAWVPPAEDLRPTITGPAAASD
ncbi:MAG: histidyl-tRNA synthetase [Actinomycetota bacterium]|jgi:histidyl-tRNA synthetase|nr:histidyl-tRNA synthetase [Actinomycetota bacterium]MDQ1667100.1 histidyl-tRNA synthetase [Actinomycetota bacterium]